MLRAPPRFLIFLVEITTAGVLDGALPPELDFIDYSYLSSKNTLNTRIN